jgi:modulator of FtsH protease HflK
MPWSNQSGGPWGQRGSKGGGPWGAGPSGGGGGGAPPDLEEILRRSQDRLKDFMPGGGSMGGKGAAVILLAALLLWLATGFYTVRPNEVGLNLIFGRFVGQTSEGLRYNLPYPIGQVVKPSVTNVNTVEVGFRTGVDPRRGGRDVLEESLMLTGDENIVDVDFIIQWQINPARPGDFVFNIQDPAGTIKAVGESAMRDVIGRRNIQPILTTDRGVIEQDVKQLMQDTLDYYGAGVIVRLVQLQKVDPPQQVIDAFRDVQAARADQERLQNEAQTYANRVIPEARGRAAQIIQAAEAYREQTVAEAVGQAARFVQVYEQYRLAPEVTRERMFLETMERVLGGTEKVIIDSNGAGQGVVPYLPLDQLNRRQPVAGPGQPFPQQQVQGAVR